MAYMQIRKVRVRNMFVSVVKTRVNDSSHHFWWLGLDSSHHFKSMTRTRLESQKNSKRLDSSYKSQRLEHFGCLFERKNGHGGLVEWASAVFLLGQGFESRPYHDWEKSRKHYFLLQTTFLAKLPLIWSDSKMTRAKNWVTRNDSSNLLTRLGLDSTNPVTQLGLDSKKIEMTRTRDPSDSDSTRTREKWLAYNTAQ